ncbi:UNKNOWN [Stylonychia lemnae]|uniref:Uncharacterized protein n=1 Tax=Stylonychia lemnae TaxID=5949 RepID=A0A077ZSG9_STYLE|nr:UNKNOWN [Stylonychia lemnae]|eukprot:CDW72818.1 UNKNOWN [Stylonychia lemnae]
MDRKPPSVGAVPPGMEGEHNKLLQDKAITVDFMGLLQSDLVPQMSKHKGYSYVYKFPENSDAQQSLMKQLRVANTFLKDSGISNSIEAKYPSARIRIFGGTNPGEKERRAKITSARKTTRGQVNLLCRYMLFKKGKFTPGKMV